jgi:hypothetical protein
LVDAYVLVQADRNGHPLAGDLQSVPDVVWAEDLEGAYDAIALTRAASVRELMESVLPQIRGLPGVTHALPAPVAHPDGDGSTLRDPRSTEPAAA